jgi:hypothetical protein
MAEVPLSYTASPMHNANMIIRSDAVQLLWVATRLPARARRGVKFVKFGHLDTAR